MNRAPWARPDPAAFAALGEALSVVADLPSQLDRIERLLHAGALPEKRLLTFREAAALLGVSERKIYDLVKRGDLPVRHIDSKRTIAVTDLDAYVESLGGDER